MDFTEPAPFDDQELEPPRFQKYTKELSKDGGGIEIALAAVFFGLLGWWLDGKMNTTPILFIGFFIFGFIGAAFNAYYRYMLKMEEHDQEAKPRNAQSTGF